jgi:hypothetical protein
LLCDGYGALILRFAGSLLRMASSAGKPRRPWPSPLDSPFFNWLVERGEINLPDGLAERYKQFQAQMRKPWLT